MVADLWTNRATWQRVLLVILAIYIVGSLIGLIFGVGHTTGSSY